MKNKLRILHLTLSLAVVVSMAQAQTPRMDMGVNVGYAVDWSGEYPFVDLMKYSRLWGTINSEEVPGGVNAFNTELIDQIPQDTSGYPLELPYAVPGAEAPQMAHTMWHHGGTLPPGEYVVLYDGAGEFEFWGDVQVVSTDTVAKRIVIEFLPGNDDAMVIMVLRRSEPGNHIHNIRVLMPGTEFTYDTQPWSEDWIDKLLPFSNIRFMNWSNTLYTTRSQWSERARSHDYSFTPDGVPYEWMARLANDYDKDLWVNIPYAADTTYIRNMATLFREEVEAGRTIYVELSNEIWNPEYIATHYLSDNGDQNTPWPERIVPFIQEALDIWTEVFAGEEHRIVRVVGTQTGWLEFSERVALNMRPGSFDAISPAAYIYTSEEYTARLHAGSTADSVLALAREIMIEEEWPLQQQQADLARRTNSRMIYYEGGQGFVPQPSGTVQPYTQAMMDAQTHPDIYDLYVDWLHLLETLEQDALFMHFALVWRPLNEGRYGLYGALYNQFDSPASYRTVAPKYQALLDYINGVTTGSNSGTPPPSSGDGTFTSVLNVADALGYSRALTYGFADGATDAWDTGLDVTAPPSPPLGAFDARILGDDGLLSDFRGVSENLTVWSIEAQTTSGATPMVITWDPLTVPTTGEILLTDNGFEIDMRSQSSYTIDAETARLDVVYIPAVSYAIEVGTGWNLLSMPVAVANATPETLFPSAQEGSLYNFDGLYTQQSTMQPGDGYWLRFSQPETITVTNERLEAVAVPIEAGWNLIGGPGCEVPSAAISDPDGVLIAGTLQGFMGQYDESTTLLPGHGYWVRALADGSITVSCDAVSTAAAAKSGKPDPSTLGFSTLVVTDAVGNEKQMYVGSTLPDGVLAESYSLPPIPPAGAFDVRFADHTALQQGADLLPLAIQAKHYPLQVRLEGAGHAYTITIGGDEEAHVLTPGHSLSLDAGTTLQLKEVGETETLPQVFALEQNYPNPFNPSTDIRFSLPEAGAVTLDVFNLLGQRVAVLVQGETLSAGAHQIRFRADDLPSGTYAYRLKANGQIQTRVMTLVK